MHQIHIYFMLEANKGLEYFSILLPSKVVLVRFYESDSLGLKLPQSEFHTLVSCYSFVYLELSGPHSLFSSWVAPSSVWPWRHRQPKVGNKEKWVLFPKCTPLHFPLPLFPIARLSSALIIHTRICCSLILFSLLYHFLIVLFYFIILASMVSLVLPPSFTVNIPEVESIHLSASKLSTPFLTQ